jgi:spermidine/putrescine transport system permease protein
VTQISGGDGTNGGGSRLVTGLMVGPAAGFFALLLVLPLVVVVVYSFGERAPAGGYQPGFTFDNYLNLPARGKASLNKLTLAPVGALLCALIAYPLA